MKSSPCNSTSIPVTDEDEFAQYRPQGPCARCGKHPATEPWFVHIRGLEGYYEGRCVCCVVAGKLEHARKTLERMIKRIPELEAALETALKECQ